MKLKLAARNCYDKKENKWKCRSEQLQVICGISEQTASSYMTKDLRISSYIRKPYLIYDFATAPFWISLFMRKILSYFLSVCQQIFPIEQEWVNMTAFFGAVKSSSTLFPAPSPSPSTDSYM